jgi:hypothetical protein
MLIDVAFSGDRNVIKKEAEKTLRYKDLTTEIKRVWNVKTKETGATGTISQLFGKYLRNISGKHEIKEIQKAVILCAAHTLREVLIMQKYKTRTVRNNIISTINCDYSRAATPYTLETWFVSGI